MLWVTLFVAAVISLAVILYVVRPLLDRSPAPVFVEDDRLTDLLSRKDVVLRAMKDLEFDRTVGKLEEVDYVRFNQSLSRQALSLMQQIEKIAPFSQQHEDALEIEIAKLRKTKDRSATGHSSIDFAASKKPTPSPNLPEDALEQEIASVRKTKDRTDFATVTVTPKLAISANGNSTKPVAEKSKFCTECGQPISPNHKFCANCGVALV